MPACLGITPLPDAAVAAGAAGAAAAASNNAFMQALVCARFEPDEE